MLLTRDWDRVNVCVALSLYSLCPRTKGPLCLSCSSSLSPSPFLLPPSAEIQRSLPLVFHEKDLLSDILIVVQSQIVVGPCGPSSQSLIHSPRRHRTPSRSHSHYHIVSQIVDNGSEDALKTYDLLVSTFHYTYALVRS